MKKITSMLLFPILIPIILFYVICIFNLNKQSKLKILTWQTPEFSIGLICSITFSLGAVYSSGSILLDQNNPARLRRTIIKDSLLDSNLELENIQSNNDFDENIYANPTNQEDFVPNERDLKDPPPTISIPYRIIQRGFDSNKSNKYQNEEYISSNDYENSDIDEESISYKDDVERSQDWGDNNEEW
tara:strand:+ start:855 stop:1415 length:561 start_codon:yes stop_codon:yes gene_type:complete